MATTRIDPDLEFAGAVWAKYGSALEASELASSVADGSEGWRLRVAKMTAWAWQWADDGFWMLTGGHKFCAALACTPTNGMEDVELPGRALRLTLPDGLFPAATTVYFLIEPSGECLFQVNSQREWAAKGPSPEAFALYARDLKGLLFSEPDESHVSKEQERLLLMAKRVFVGLLYAMQHTDNFRFKSYATSGPKRDGRGPPDHRVVFVGGPISIDARPQVEAWLSVGKRSAPSLQHIVRGHYKRQVVGVSGTGRKVIWVEPYWRGPEGAPILVHARKVGS